MNSKNRFPNVHPLKGELKRKRITLWRLRNRLGGSPSEFKLSRMLSGIEPMSRKFEERIKEVIETYDQDSAEIQRSEHPLKKVLKCRLPLEDIDKFTTGLPEVETLSRMLDGFEPMEKELEEFLYEFCDEWDRGHWDALRQMNEEQGLSDEIVLED